MIPIKTNLYKASLALKGITQEDLAKLMGMSSSTLIRKIKNDTFTLEEAKRMAEILDLTNPTEFFFDNLGT